MHLKLENFDGPLDSLLYLIKSQDLNIFDIPIARITTQFLGFIRQTVNLDFYQAGDYLAMAAQLIEIKTNALLPTLKNNSSAQSLDEIPDEDPRKPLVEQLLEYEMLKKASEELAKKVAIFADVFPSAEHKRRSEEWEGFDRPIKGNPFDLAIAFERVLLEYSHIKTLPKVQVHTQKITIEQKMKEVTEKLQHEHIINLKDLIIPCDSRYELIVLLMALLELCQTQSLVLIQNNEFADIFLERGLKFSINETYLREPGLSQNIDVGQPGN